LTKERTSEYNDDVTDEQIEKLIKECQAEAAKAIESGNPPFGCVITDLEGNIVARACNTQNSETDPTAHAEINSLRQLGRKLKTRYLDDYVVFANASSCSMCMSACIKARITRFYFGAPPGPNMDPWLPVQEVAAKAKNPIALHGPILGDECAAQITLGHGLTQAKVP
jgi:tRNA(Arg) A34 adenosine deaminase TadA